MPGKDVWMETLHHWYGDDVVQATHACLHCLTRGKMQFQWHEEINSPDLVLANTHAFDHYSLWRIGSEPLVFVTQPYGFHHEDIRTLLDFCDQHGLELGIDERAAFHRPGEVVGITIWNRAVRQKHYRSNH